MQKKISLDPNSDVMDIDKLKRVLKNYDKEPESKKSGKNQKGEEKKVPYNKYSESVKIAIY